MLCEIHAPLAEELAKFIDLTDVHRILDLGGGSGVIAMALLRRHPNLEAVVADIPNVCAAGREIASENEMAERIQYLALDFVQEPIPVGFDLVLECDVGSYDKSFFQKIHGSLNPGGRLIVVDQFAVDPQTPHPARLHWAFLSALESTASSRSTAHDIRGRLERAGFHVRNQATLPAGDPVRWVRGWTLIEAVA
jgi:16S rRNA G1207 methylase RsmC